MALSPLGKRNIKMMERETGLKIVWGSVFCHQHHNLKETGQDFRFWARTDTGVRLGVYNTKTKLYKLTDETRLSCRTVGCPGYSTEVSNPECNECRVTRIRKDKE